MVPKIKVGNEYIKFTDFLKGNNEHYECKPSYTITYCANNNSLQVRCANCGKFLGNVKYDDFGEPKCS